MFCLSPSIQISFSVVNFHCYLWSWVRVYLDSCRVNTMSIQNIFMTRNGQKRSLIELRSQINLPVEWTCETSQLKIWFVRLFALLTFLKLGNGLMIPSWVYWHLSKLIWMISQHEEKIQGFHDYGWKIRDSNNLFTNVWISGDILIEIRFVVSFFLEEIGSSAPLNPYYNDSFDIASHWWKVE